MHTLNRYAALWIMMTLWISPLKAGMQDNLEKAFGALGMSNNVTAAGGYQDQTGGYYTGGSVFGRGRVNNAELLSLQMPHYRAGCGGIDLFLGGFSFVNTAQFTQLLRNIGSGASGYAFNLALATVTPQIKSVLDGLLDKVQTMTNQNINSCEVAATLVGGAWPQSDASSQLLCNAMSKELNIVSDWAASHQRCGAEEGRTDINKRKNEKPGYKDILGDEFNIAWKAIQKNAFLKNDVKLSEFFMTLSGTIISRKKGQGRDERIEAVVLPSKSGDSTLLSALIKGLSAVEIYKCDDPAENKCLSPTFQKLTLPANKSLHGQVQTLLDSISTKIRNGEGKVLSPEEKGFVNATMIPILKIIAVEVAFKEGGAPLSINNFSEAIAHDILLQYLDEVMSLVWDSVTQMKKVQINEDMIEEFRAGIADSRKLLFTQRTALFEQLSTTLDLIERTQQIEKKLQNIFISGSVQREK